MRPLRNFSRSSRRRSSTTSRPPLRAVSRYGESGENGEKKVAMTPVSIAHVAERLFVEFETQLPLDTIVATVRQSGHDIDGVPEPALPELVERLARQRLIELARQPPGLP